MAHSLDSNAIVAALAAYLLGHPLAVDSIDGIRRWWMDEEDDVTLNQMREALTWMQARALIEEVCAADGRRLWRRTATDDQLRALCPGRAPD